MDAKELRAYIFNNNLINKIIEDIGCHSIVSYSKEIRCALPHETDNSKVSIFLNEDLNVRVFTKGETIYGSIYDLIMFVLDVDFRTAYRRCLNLLGLSVSFNRNEKNKHLEFFKGIRKKRYGDRDDKAESYSVNILDKYSKTPHIDLIRKDGIFQDVIDKYDVRFDEESDRIIFPHFKHDDKSRVVGIVGRTVNPAYKELNIPKYFSMDGIKYEKSRNFYGMSHNMDEIKNREQIIVFESEKSVMKADMFGYPVGVSVGCHDLSEWQKKMLISLDVEVVIAFDNDVENLHIERLCNELSMFCTVSYIKDKWGLLRAKDSPVDRGVTKFNFLLKHRVKI